MNRSLYSITIPLLLFCLMSIGGRLSAQDPVLSQFYSAPIMLNPAFTGTTNSPRISLNYRNQWASIFNAYTTYSVSYDQYIEDFRSGIGFNLLVDQAGDGIYKTAAFNVIYSYRLGITDEIFIKGGIQAGLHQTSLDWDKLVFLDQLDPLDGQAYLTEEDRPLELTKGALDVSTGLLIYSPIFYGGISLHHVNTPNQSILGTNEGLIDGLPMRLSLHGGAQISLSKNNKKKNPAFISPNIMYTKQRNFQQINLGTYVGMGPIFGGVWYRHAFSNSDAAIFLLGFTKGIFKLGYSYDLTVSQLSSESNGSHELSILFNLDNGKKKPLDYNDCFKLFR